tara:strand:- start:2108 stop:2356 length:249 start_codon:yes stop_codon:yes gene_type:complete
MFPTKSQIHARQQQVRKAQLRARVARQQLRQSVRAAAVSPPGLLAGFVLGFSGGHALSRHRAESMGLGPSHLSLLLTLLRWA